MSTTQLLGRFGEAAVAAYLREKGYRIVAANYCSRFGEIDLIAEDGAFLCFVEVKLRKSGRFAEAREFVTAAKQEKLRITAEIYLSQQPSALQPRFDVAEVYAPQGIETARLEIRYWAHAF
jgi:TIGR00252 family protein